MGQSVPNLRAETILLDVPGANASAFARRTAATQAALIQLLAQQVRQSTDGAGPVKEFDWITRKPSTIYYPAYATQSLDDTPEIYGRAQTRDVHLRRSLQHYLESHGAKDITESPGYTISNINSYIPQRDLCLLDLFDIFQSSGFEFYTERRRCGPPSASKGRKSSTHSKSSSHGIADDSTLSSYETVMHSLNDSVCMRDLVFLFYSAANVM